MLLEVLSTMPVSPSPSLRFVEAWPGPEKHVGQEVLAPKRGWLAWLESRIVKLPYPIFTYELP